MREGTTPTRRPVVSRANTTQYDAIRIVKPQLHIGFTDLDEAVPPPFEQQGAGVVGVFPAVALHVGEVHEQEAGGGEQPSDRSRYPRSL